MTSLKKLKTQIENANALGVANLTDKGVDVPANATTYDIMSRIAEVSGEPDGIGRINPTMTSNYSPSGECFATSVAWKCEPYIAFQNKNLDELVGTNVKERHIWGETTTVEDAYIGYDFGLDNSYHISKVIYYPSFYMVNAEDGATYKIQGSNNKIDWDDISENVFIRCLGYTSSGAILSRTEIPCVSDNAYRYVRVKVVNFPSGNGYVSKSAKPNIYTAQIEIYGSKTKVENLDTIETLIDSSGVLEDTEGSVSDKVEQLIDKADFIGVKYSNYTGDYYNLPKTADARSLDKQKTANHARMLQNTFSNMNTNPNGGYFAFLEEVYLPETATALVTTFANCSRLTTVRGGLSNILELDVAFKGCVSIDVNAIIAKMTGLRTIGKNSFQNCTQITEITLPATIQTIDGSAFTGCTNIQHIYCPWAEGEVANAPWGATNATIHYNYVEGEETNAES